MITKEGRIDIFSYVSIMENQPLFGIFLYTIFQIYKKKKKKTINAFVDSSFA